MAKKRSETRVRPEYPDERIGNFLRGLVLGALAGGVGALLQAERSGAETRAMIREQVQAAWKNVRETAADVRATVTDAVAWSAEEPASWTPAPASADALTLETIPPATTQPLAEATITEPPETPEAVPAPAAGSEPLNDAPTAALPPVDRE